MPKNKFGIEVSYPSQAGQSVIKPYTKPPYSVYDAYQTQLNNAMKPQTIAETALGIEKPESTTNTTNPFGGSPAQTSLIPMQTSNYSNPTPQYQGTNLYYGNQGPQQEVPAATSTQLPELIKSKLRNQGLARNIEFGFNSKTNPFKAAK
jgi:hypothetical protein